MTFLGKIFSVLVLVFSIVFLTLAIAVNATHRNWRDAVLDPNNGLKVQVETAARQNQQLRESLQNAEFDLAQEQAARRTALAALQTRLDQLQDELQNSEAEVQQLQGAYTELTQIERSRAEELARLTSDNADLRSQIQEEREDRDALFVRATQLTDRLNSLESLLEIEGERNEQLVSQNTRYKEVVDAHGINVSDPIDRSPPDVRGEVLVVNQPQNLVELSIGYDEGLRTGHMLDVTRGDRYLGRVRVRRAEPDRAVAEIMNDYREGVIQRGDRVDTTFD